MKLLKKSVLFFSVCALIFTLMIIIQSMFGHYVIVFDKISPIVIKVEQQKYIEVQNINESNAILLRFKYKKYYDCNPIPFLKFFTFFGEVSFPKIKNIYVKISDENNEVYDITKYLKNHIHINMLMNLSGCDESCLNDLFIEQNNYSIDSICKEQTYRKSHCILCDLQGYKVIMDGSEELKLINVPNGYSYLGNIETTLMALNGYSLFYDNEYPKEILYFFDMPQKQLKQKATIQVELVISYESTNVD